MSLITLAISVLLFFGVILGLIAFLPDASLHPLPDSISAAIYFMYHSFAAMNYLLPVRTILDLFLLTITYELVLWVWKLVRWILSLIRGARI